MHFGMNQFIWLTTHLVIQPLFISSGLCILYPSSVLYSKLWNMDYVSALHALSGLQVSGSGLSTSHFLLELCYTSHHLSLFPFLSSGFVLLIYQGSVYTPPRSNFWSPRCSERLLLLLSTYLTHLITVTFLSLSMFKFKSFEIRDCVLFTGFPQGPMLGTSWILNKCFLNEITIDNSVE